MTISKALPSDDKTLTDLTIASKAYWDYAPEQIVEWHPVLTITQEYISKRNVFKLLDKGEVVGYYSYYFTEETEAHLDNMFIHPNHIGKGIGRMLMNDFVKRIKAEGMKSIIAYSDPNAEGFYAHFGFEVIGNEPTSIKNRFLPIMKKMVQ